MIPHRYETRNASYVRLLDELERIGRIVAHVVRGMTRTRSRRSKRAALLGASLW